MDDLDIIDTCSCGRPGVFNSDEAFVHIIDSMSNRHARRRKLYRERPWREPVVAYLAYRPAHHEHVRQNGDDVPEGAWTWAGAR